MNVKGAVRRDKSNWWLGGNKANVKCGRKIVEEMTGD